MQYLTGLVFEFTPACNLGKEHNWCPNRHPERFAASDKSNRLSPSMICLLAKKATVEFGFSGAFAFHYYNEPLVHPHLLFEIVDLIGWSLELPKFLLWTNGLLMEPWMKLDLESFSTVIVTDYGKLDRKKILTICPHAEIITFAHDDRLVTLPERPGSQPSCCLRPMTELIIDYHGQVHTCCQDWRAEFSPGNVLMEEPADVFRRWREYRDQIVCSRTIADMPPVCRRCPQHNWRLQAYDPEAGQRAVEYAIRARSELDGRRNTSGSH